MAFLKRAWMGETKLWIVFWVYGVLASILFKLGSYLLLVAVEAAWPVIVILCVAYCVWWFVSLWRCAYNTKVKFFGHLARGYVILVPMFIVLSLIFNDTLMQREAA